jgi:hypothetical protein
METGYQSWTDEKLAAEASKYATRAAFKQSSSGAYDAAWKRGILDEICSHMETVQQSWTDELLAAEASKYSTRSDFSRGSSAYTTAQKRGILDEICSHMESDATSDNDALYVWRAENTFHNGYPVYKVGVTSARLGDVRMQQVARAGGFKAEPVLQVTVEAGTATDLERYILERFGQDPEFVGFDGCSEFRAFRPDELAQIVELAKEKTTARATDGARC